MKVCGCFLLASISLVAGQKEFGEKEWNQIQGKNAFVFFQAPW